MGKHDGHKLIYVLNACVVEQVVTITADGNVTHVPDNDPEITDWDGDGTLYCDTCNEQIYGGEHGLSEYWEVV